MVHTKEMGTIGLQVTVHTTGLRFKVHAKPRAHTTQVKGVSAEGALELQLSAPPVDGAANEELVRFLSDALGVPKRAVHVLRGETARKKLVEVQGIDVDLLRERLFK